MIALLRLPVTVFVLLYQSVVLALSQIWANKVRGVLTTLGILIGVAAVSAVIALITGMREKVLSEFEAFGTNKIFVWPQWPRNRNNISYWDVAFRITDFDEMLEHCPSVARYARQRGLGGSLSFGSKTETENVNIMGVDPQWQEIERRTVSTGRPLSVLDNELKRPVCLINEMTRDKLNLDRDPVGQYIEWENNRLLVIGLLEPPPTSMGRNQEAREVVVPFNYASKFNPWWYSVQADSKGPSYSEDAKAEVEFYLRQKRRIKPGDPDTFRVMSAAHELQEFNQIAGTVTMIAMGIVGVSLLVGGVGIMNIMLVSVSERTREIGLRKAVGARPAAILLQFLVEAVVLCMIGGALGLAVGQGITSVVVKFLPKEANITSIIIPPSAILLAFGFSAGVGLVFGMFPAIKAARLDPIEALRHE
jgi:putative ABC transport system permease protein